MAGVSRFDSYGVPSKSGAAAVITAAHKAAADHTKLVDENTSLRRRVQELEAENTELRNQWSTDADGWAETLGTMKAERDEARAQLADAHQMLDMISGSGPRRPTDDGPDPRKVVG